METCGHFLKNDSIAGCAKMVSQNKFPKFEQFVWLIGKSVLILAIQNAQENSVLGS